VDGLFLPDFDLNFATNPLNITGNSNASRTDAGASSSFATKNPMSLSWPFADSCELEELLIHQWANPDGNEPVNLNHKF